MWLLDTVAISETIKAKPNLGFIDWLGSVSEDDLYTSVLCLGEIERGIHRLPAGRKRQDLERWMGENLPSWFGSRVHEIDRRVTSIWARMARHTDRAAIDALVGATARMHGLTVVTRNVRDFDGLGVAVLNPWTP